MKQNKWWRTFLAVGVSALAFPAFVQSQTSGAPSPSGSSPSGVRSPHSATGTMGAEETPGTSGTTGSSRMGEGSSSSSSSMSATDRPGSSAMSDQAMTEADRALNQRIRQELTSDSDLRASASNVHFNTDNGKVTLQGTVATEQEKQDIEDKVEQMTGVEDVDNQLQIASTSSSSTSSMGSSSSTRSSESGAMGSSSGTVTR